MCKKKKKFKRIPNTSKAKVRKRIFPINNTEELLHLMDIYLSEWEHRDSQFWNQAFLYFATSLTIIVLPLFTFWEEKDLLKEIPKVIFPLVGLIMAFLFMCIMLGYCKRMEVSHDIYTTLIKRLPPPFRRKQLKKEITKKKGNTKGLIKFFTVHSIMKIGSIIMFSALMILALLVGILSLLNPNF